MKEDNSDLWAESKARRERSRNADAILVASVFRSCKSIPGEFVKKLRGMVDLTNVKSEDFYPQYQQLPSSSCKNDTKRG